VWLRPVDAKALQCAEAWETGSKVACLSLPATALQEGRRRSLPTICMIMHELVYEPSVIFDTSRFDSRCVKWMRKIGDFSHPFHTPALKTRCIFFCEKFGTTHNLWHEQFGVMGIVLSQRV